MSAGHLSRQFPLVLLADAGRLFTALVPDIRRANLVRITRATGGSFNGSSKPDAFW
jgi:hypothetical protein